MGVEGGDLGAFFSFLFLFFFFFFFSLPFFLCCVALVGRLSRQVWIA